MSVHEKFSHDEKDFEIRTAQIKDKYCVKIFLNDKQVSPVYSVDIETHTNYFMQHQQSLINNLKTIAKSDIEKGMYYKT